MIFKLIRFRDGWMRTGKAKKEKDGLEFIEPLHLVLIEEPEAHLHTQVQQVFIKKAYEVLRFHSELNNKERFTTQMIVSTHSSYIAHQIDFSCLRYFKRERSKTKCDVPCVSVVNLSELFGTKTETARFTTRYLKTTHCDLFFADGIIIIEGAAERMLLPLFIKNTFEDLDRCYISILEISGSHAHTLRDLIEKLSLFTLIVTDLDSINNISKKKIQPELNKGYITNNSTLKNWIPQKEHIDDLFKDNISKISSNGFVRVAYQYPIKIPFDGRMETVIPYTFEDALVLTNLEIFKKMPRQKGLLNSMIKHTKNASLKKVCTNLYSQINKSKKKAEMALDLLFIENINELKPPEYLEEGLKWLDEQLKIQCKDPI